MMAHRLFTALRTARVRPVLSRLSSGYVAGCTTTETWHSALPGMALLLAGAAGSTVCLCESESRRTSPADSVRAERLTHTTNWKVYTDKAVQLAREQKLEDAEKYMSLALSEAIKGFGTEDPHTAEACQNLADHYAVMHKYDLAVPLYVEVVESLTSLYGPQDGRTVTALHTLAGLYMAQKNVLAASKTMLRAIEAGPLNSSDNGRLKDQPDAVWKAVAESARDLAATYREAGHSAKEVVELLEKDLRFLTKEGEGYLPGTMVMTNAMSGTYIFEEQGERIKALSDAEAICRALISNLKNYKDPKKSSFELSCLYERLAGILRAQGRLDEARQLCVEANNHYLVYVGKQVAKSNSDLPALELLIEIELEDGSRDSLLRALDYRQECCKREQADLDEIITAIESGALGSNLGPVVRYILRTNLTEELTDARQRLAEVQRRLDEKLDAWTTLTQALAVLQSPQALELQKVEHPFATRLRERAGERKQEIQHQMSALYKAICSPLADGNAEQCVNLQQQLTAALAA